MINLKNNEIAALTFCYACICLYILRITNFSANAGVYVGAALAVIIVGLPKKLFYLISPIFPIFLYLNLLFSAINAFLRDYFIIPPILGFSNGVYVEGVTRSISLFAYEIIVNRPTGLSDNIHVTALLNLFLVFYLVKKRKLNQSYLVAAVLISGLNIQFILILIVWAIIFHRKISVNLLNLIFLAFLFLFLFYLLDYFLLQGFYIPLLVETISSSLVDEMMYYIEAFDFARLMFGIKSGTVEDIADASVAPLTDFGFLGIPIQYGILGITCFLATFILFHKKGDRDVSVFLACNYISFVHYVPLISLPGLIFTAWLSRYFSNDLCDLLSHRAAAKRNL